jgi:hypothetical protein
MCAACAIATNYDSGVKPGSVHWAERLNSAIDLVIHMSSRRDPYDVVQNEFDE